MVVCYYYINGVGTPISTRLQQLVDSVAVNQISSQANQIKNSLQQSKTRTIQPKVSSLTIPQNGLQKVEILIYIYIYMYYKHVRTYMYMYVQYALKWFTK